MNFAKSARPAAMRAMAADRRSISARREGRCGMPSSSKRSMWRRSWAMRATGSARKRRAPTATRAPAASSEQGEADRQQADGAVDLGQELGLGHDDRELPALEPQGREGHGVAGAADLEADLLLDVRARPRAGPRPARRRPAPRPSSSGASCRSSAIGAMTTPPCRPDHERAAGAPDRDRAQQPGEAVIVHHRGQDAGAGPAGEGHRPAGAVGRARDVDPERVGRGRAVGEPGLAADQEPRRCRRDGAAGSAACGRAIDAQLAHRAARRRRAAGAAPRRARLWSAITSPAGGTSSSQDSAVEGRLAASMIRSGGSPLHASSSRSRMPCDRRSTSPTTAHHSRRTAAVICVSSTSTSSRLTEVAVRHQARCSAAADRTMPPTTMPTSAVRRPSLRPAALPARLAASSRAAVTRQPAGGRWARAPPT